MIPDRRRTALVLSGGGSYAAYEVGVMKALFAGHSPATGYQPFEPDIIVASGAGALNAGVLAAHDERGLEEAVRALEHIWINHISETASSCGNGIYRVRGLSSEFFNPGCYWSKPLGVLRDALDDGLRAVVGTASLAASPSRLLDPLGAFRLDAFIDVEPLLKSVQQFIPLERLRNTRQHLRIATTNARTGQIRIFNETEIVRLGHAPFLASAALPGFFPPREIEGDPYIDASLLMDTPLRPAFTEAEDLHVIYMDPNIGRIERTRLQSSVDVFDRIRVVRLAYAINQDIRTVRAINRGLKVMESAGGNGPLTKEDIECFLRTAGRIYRRITEGKPYSKLTIHRYHPSEDLGESLGFLNLNVDHVRRIIDRGYHDAVAYDPVKSRSVLPS